MDLVWLFNLAASLDKGSVSIRHDQLPYERKWKWKKNPAIVFPNLLRSPSPASPAFLLINCSGRLDSVQHCSCLSWWCISSAAIYWINNFEWHQAYFSFLPGSQTSYSYYPSAGTPDKCGKAGGCWGETHWCEFDRQLRMSLHCRKWNQ